jgi:hypothetical protein
MLSHQAAELAQLVIQRHTLICRAIELDNEHQLMTLIRTANAHASGSSALERHRDEVLAELVLMPLLIDDVEASIGAAWDRLRFLQPK